MFHTDLFFPQCRASLQKSPHTRVYTVPKIPLGLGILGKPPGDYSNGRDLTLTVRGYSLAIMSTSIKAASLTLGKINPIVRRIRLTLRKLHKKITLKLEYIPKLTFVGSIGIILDDRIRGVFALNVLLPFASFH